MSQCIKLLLLSVGTGTKRAGLPKSIGRPDLQWSGYATVGMSSGLCVDNRLKKSVRPTKTSLCQKPGMVETNEHACILGMRMTGDFWKMRSAPANGSASRCIYRSKIK